jgi:CDP-6-deoxy-D-xylo-4-hexulose-3-dehydrase
LDSDPLTLNVRGGQLEEAFHAGKTKAVMMAHTLGNPFDLRAVTDFCTRHALWLIEDNCDALGSEYFFPDSLDPSSPAGSPKAKRQKSSLTGTFGDMSTQSFYPAHHMTLGEGGAVNIPRDMSWKVLIESFRDWGRDCWCASGKDDTCGKRFGWQLGELPEGYDHKYIYSHLGYNLKPLDLQAAIGREQIKKLPSFISARREHWQYLRAALADLEEFFDFQLPTHATSWNAEYSAAKPTSPSPPFKLSSFSWDSSGCWSDPSWFGFMLGVKPGAPFTRTLFGGNLTRQPALTQLRRENPGAFRVIGDLAGADTIMDRTLFIGVYPGLTRDMLDFMVATIRRFVS